MHEDANIDIVTWPGLRLVEPGLAWLIVIHDTKYYTRVTYFVPGLMSMRVH